MPRSRGKNRPLLCDIPTNDLPYYAREFQYQIPPIAFAILPRDALRAKTLKT